MTYEDALKKIGIKAEAAKKWAETWNRELSQLPRLEEKMFPDQIKDYAERLMKINADFLADTALDEAPKPTIPHLAERKLWLAQREAGTNEGWQYKCPNGTWSDIPVNEEPAWHPVFAYRPKPKTVTYYLAMLRYAKQGSLGAHVFDSIKDVSDYAERHNCAIIGDIETREVEITDKG